MKARNNPPPYTIPIVHLEIVKDSAIHYGTVQVQTSSEMADLFKSIIGKRNTENMLICTVDARNQPSLLQITGIGTVDYCQFSVPDIWKAALISNASGVIVSHNHPSGNVSPSIHDLEATKKLIAAGNTIGIPLIDHIIVFGDKHYSFHDDRPCLWD